MDTPDSPGRPDPHEADDGVAADASTPPQASSPAPAAKKPRRRYNVASRPKREKLALSIPVARADELRRRSREAAMTFGDYLCGLLDGCPPAPLPADYSQMVAALMASTTRLAALSVDIHAFMRRMDRDGAAGSCRDSLLALDADVRSHLIKASSLLLDLSRTRRP